MWKKTARPRKPATPNPIAAVFGAVRGGTQTALHAALTMLTFPLRVAGAVRGRGAKGAATMIAVAVAVLLVIRRGIPAFSYLSCAVYLTSLLLTLQRQMAADAFLVSFLPGKRMLSVHIQVSGVSVAEQTISDFFISGMRLCVCAFRFVSPLFSLFILFDVDSNT